MGVVDPDMESKSMVALRETVAPLEVLVGGPIDGGDVHTIFERLQTLIDDVLHIGSRVGECWKPVVHK